MRGLSAVTLFFKLYAEYIMRNTELDELQAEMKIGGKSINSLVYVDSVQFSHSVMSDSS